MFWEVVQKDVIKAIQEFFEAKSLLKEINATFLMLIPKVSGADSLDLFKPISLCNSFYKIISKILTSRTIKITSKFRPNLRREKVSILTKVGR